MKNKLAALIIFSNILLCWQLLSVPRLAAQKMTPSIFTRYDYEGNKIVEEYDKVLVWDDDAEDHKKGEPMLRKRTYYKGDTDVKVKEEEYRRLDGTLKTITHYKDGVKYLEESYYSSDYTLKGGRRGFLESKRYFYGTCDCEEFYNGGKAAQYKVIYRKDGRESTVYPSRDRLALCSDADCIQ